jgi:mevalonate kinase
MNDLPRDTRTPSDVGSSRRSTARAWGKVILLGEHAVVYGVPAIAIGIDRGALAHCDSPEDEMLGGSGPCRLRVEGWEVSVSEDEQAHDLARAFRALLDAHRQSGGSANGLTVTARSDLPPGGGLGCSAALGVAIAKAISPSASLERIQELAMAWERIFHGSPSGVDAAVSSQGGCILFERGQGIEPVGIQGGLSLCIGSTGVASSTKTMVEAVARLRQRRPTVVEKTFEGITSLVRNARLAIEAGDKVGLGRLMDLNQMLLGGLFVSTEEIEHMCGLARGVGALGAKLTGAGGGGCVVALVGGPVIAERVLEAWRAKGFWGFSTRLAGHEASFVEATGTP